MSDATLARRIDLWGVVALGLGTAVGVSIFSAIAPAAKIAGPAMLFSALIAALPMYLIAVSYAFLGSACPASGASFVWPARFLHPTWGFCIGWARIVANVGAIVVLALVLVRYASMLVPLPTKPTMLALLALALVANLFGMHIATRVQKVLLVGMLLLFAVFVAWGASRGVDVARLQPLFPHGITGMIAATPLLMGLFFGIEAATEAGAEVADSRRTIPLGIALSIGSATLLYLAVGFVALGVLGGDALGASDAPILDAAKRFMGPWATPLVVLAAVLSIGKSLNALFAMFSRSLYAMGVSGMLPSALGRVHPRWQTPHVALVTVFALGCVGLLLPMELTFLFLAVNIPNLLKYGSICVAAARVAERHPDIYDAAAFKPGRRRLRIAGYGGAASAFLLIFAGLETDWRPYALLLVWMVCGLVFLKIRSRRSPAAPPA
ncbi:amino acid permease [Sphingomonas sp. Leaf407]|uniref:APC family permease n=1 Tax=unclassified Sphingomonas TaxID=196159 RepID=UPI0006FAF217|nr:MULTISPECIES: amino acid permease [unclassified Sphingomonas]KQN39873.1 amino acid permease [Sphingomonas sp. Leaf42]KQT23659.1 amino acid permease [Sphingomonas sp. Leaf407]